LPDELLALRQIDQIRTDFAIVDAGLEALRLSP
jgi:hypothetical protein